MLQANHFIYQAIICVALYAPLICRWAGAEEPVWRWDDAGPLTHEQRKQYEDRVAELLDQVCPDVPIVQKTYARFERDDATPDDLIWANVEFCMKTGDGLNIEIGFFPPGNEKLRYYLNTSVRKHAVVDGNLRAAEATRLWKSQKPEERTGEFHTYIRTTSTQQLAVKEAERIMRDLGGADPAQFKLFSCSLVNGKWELWFYLRVGDYVASGFVIGIELADNDSLDLIRYLSNVRTSPKVRNLEVKITCEKARELGDVYLKRYYHRHELNTLEFATNRLEVVKPNHMFTPRYEPPGTATGAPTLIWICEYARKKNTLTRTPVLIFVDAGDGAMLGGWE